MCVIKDDMQSLYPKIANADAIVLASPVYWFTISAQLKLFIDRLYAQSSHWKEFAGKKAAIVLTYGDSDLYTSGGINAIHTYETMFRYMKMEIAGMVYGTEREQAGLFQAVTGSAGQLQGLRQVQPEYITGAGYQQRVGLRYSNLLGPEGDRLAAVVAPNMALVPGFAYSGSSMLFRDVFTRPGEQATYSGGIPSRDIIRLPFGEDVTRLRSAKFEFGIMKQVVDPKTGKIADYERVKDLTGAYIEPGEEMIIGKYSYRGEGGRVTEPLTLTAGSGRRWIDPSTIQLQMPREYETATGWGTSGLRTASIFEEHEAGRRVRESLDAEYRTTLQIQRKLLANNPTIRLVPAVERLVTWPYAFVLLALGPAAGILAMLRLRRLPDSTRMASGRR